MTLAAGTRLGYYEIVALLGAGGMGEVYPRDPSCSARRAQDSPVADRARSGPARALQTRSAGPRASTIPTSPRSTGSRTPRTAGLVLSWSRVRRRRAPAGGPISLQEALPIARRIAEALEAAHEQGIIHRDLKPANIKIGRTARSRCWTSASPRRWSRSAPPSRRPSPPTITSPALTHGRHPQDGVLHEPGAGQGPARRTSAATSGRLGACSTRCSPDGAPSRARGCRNAGLRAPERSDWTRCLARFRRRFGRCSKVAEAGAARSDRDIRRHASY